MITISKNRSQKKAEGGNIVSSLMSDVRRYRQQAGEASEVTIALEREKEDLLLAFRKQKARADNNRMQLSLLQEELEEYYTENAKLKRQLSREQMKVQDLQSMNEQLVEAVEELKRKMRDMLTKDEFQLFLNQYRIIEENIDRRRERMKEESKKEITQQPQVEVQGEM